MTRVCISLKRTIVAGAAIAAFLVVPGVSSAQETTTTEGSTTTSTTTAQDDSIATSSDLEVCEAVQRTHARHKKWVEQGIPEEFGSEEPFTFNPDLC